MAFATNLIKRCRLQAKVIKQLKRSIQQWKSQLSFATNNNCKLVDRITKDMEFELTWTPNEQDSQAAQHAVAEGRPQQPQAEIPLDELSPSSPSVPVEYDEVD